MICRRALEFHEEFVDRDLTFVEGRDDGVQLPRRVIPVTDSAHGTLPSLSPQ